MTRRRTLLVGLAAVALVAAGIGGAAVLRQSHRSEFEQAMALLPADTLRASWTDWAGVRDTVGETDLATAEPDGNRIRGFIEKAFSHDLSAVSSIDDSAVALALHYDFSPANATWELFGQSRAGAVMFLKLPDSVDLPEVESNLTVLGYHRPSDARGVWDGGVDVVAGIDPSISPELGYVTVLADEHLVVTSDSPGYLASAVAAATGDADALPGSGLVAEADEPLAATYFVNDFACEALAMSQADPEQQAAATRLVTQAGGIDPVTGLLVAAYADRRLRVLMEFENDDQARQNASSRASLASGVAPGQGEDFPDQFEVTAASRSGSTIRLDLHGVEGGYALSNLISGPVLFESC